MKISQLAEKYNLPKDTVQYYTKLGLLLPRQKGAGHDFTQREEEDLLYIQQLKTMQFSLKEIQQIMQWRRTSNWNEPETVCDYLRFLENREKQISQEMEGLEQALRLIQQEKNKMTAPVKVRAKLGVPVQALGYLVCPQCHSPLQLTEGEFLYPYVFGGRLECSCGWCAQIEDGVVDTGSRYTAPYDSPDLARGLYKGLPNEFYHPFNACCDRIVSTMNNMDLTGKLVLETHLNGYSFLYNHFKYLKNDCLYVCCDKYIETVRMYKELLELLGMNLNILFIADAGMDLPLMHGSVSLFLNFFAAGEHSLYAQNSLLTDVLDFLKPNAQVLGAQVTFPDGQRTVAKLHQKYPEGDLQGFSEAKLREDYAKHGFRLDYKREGTVLKTPDRYSFACHVDGEPMQIASYYAQR